MITISDLTSFFGWCAVINTGVLFISAMAIMLMRNSIANIHGKMLGLNPESLPAAYFEYLANYKILTIIFSLVPYIALRLMI